MEHIITAIFGDGVFKPSIPLDLPPNTIVRLTVVSPVAPATYADRNWEEFEKFLDEASFEYGGPIPTRDELHERD